ncbi:hypothetical protein [Motiliproteus sp. MSK22-1]|uniref:hypothetical protein n=1 Tax=Motiliproteus sp. MSK22-1 TaxID=1897630 RepID=UPI000978C13F|nr:hypothetical protein [Motiliproteus sp. MSK22-1]OMH31711.1 hypothetical protein BGP75_16440 [Motiliproteus sp. MSK22-1]
MPYKALRILKRIVENPYINIAVGLIFLYTGVSETIRELQSVEDFKLGAHHGAILFALLHILKTLPDFVEGLDYFERAAERE